MKQMGLQDTRLSKRQKQTRKAHFLEEMDQIVPWQQLLDVIEPHYPKASNGRRPTSLETMLRIHFLQHWFNYSDPGMEEALYDIPLFQQFAKIDIVVDTIPDETTLLKFRHLIERRGLATKILEAVNDHLAQRGLLLREGTAVDATLISAATSTKNQEGKRDLEMSSTKKGNQWYFGMKAHIGVDTQTGVVHSITGTAAKRHDSTQLDQLLHGEEKAVYGDKAYSSDAHNLLSNTPETGPIWCMPFKGKELPEWKKQLNHEMTRIRAIVEHPFRILKQQFGYSKVRYRGLKKNTDAITTKFALVNLYQMRRPLMAMTG